MEEYPEDFKDKLEAYPLRLDVNALPERRFVKMMRTLTISTALLAALLIILATYFNYQVTHLDVTVSNRGKYQFFYMDSHLKQLRRFEDNKAVVPVMRFVVEEKLREYLKERNTTSWGQDKMSDKTNPNKLIARVSSAAVFADFSKEIETLNAKLRGSALVRDMHLYDLQLLYGNLWLAVIDVFDMPIVEGYPLCEEVVDPQQHLECNKKNAKHQERRKIWMRTGFSKKIPPEMISSGRVSYEVIDVNPLGVSVDRYISTYVPIHPEETYWGLPPALRPDI